MPVLTESALHAWMDAKFLVRVGLMPAVGVLPSFSGRRIRVWQGSETFLMNAWWSAIPRFGSGLIRGQVRLQRPIKVRGDGTVLSTALGFGVLLADIAVRLRRGSAEFVRSGSIGAESCMYLTGMWREYSATQLRRSPSFMLYLGLLPIALG